MLAGFFPGGYAVLIVFVIAQFIFDLSLNILDIRRPYVLFLLIERAS